MLTVPRNFGRSCTYCCFAFYSYFLIALIWTSLFPIFSFSLPGCLPCRHPWVYSLLLSSLGCSLAYNTNNITWMMPEEQRDHWECDIQSRKEHPQRWRIGRLWDIWDTRRPCQGKVTQWEHNGGKGRKEKSLKEKDSLKCGNYRKKTATIHYEYR